MFLRSSTSAIIFTILLNKNLKATVLNKEIKRSQVPMLVCRTLLSVLTLVCVYVCTKSLPLVYIGLFSNIVPLSTAAMSYFILKKGLTRLELAVMVGSFIGVILLVTGEV